MLKKYTVVISIILLIIVLFQSCSKERLEVEPVNEFLSNNFFASEDQVASAIIAVYDPLGWSMAYGQWISYVMYGEIRSDNANAGGDPSNNDQPGWQEYDDFTNTNTNVVTQPLYRRNYIGIARANNILENTMIESPAVDVFLAEAKFLRAYYHFELFRHFGPVPVVTETLEPSSVDLSRNTVSEVLQQVVTDCQEAAEFLPATVTAGEKGRATKGAALALMGKAYLYWADILGDDPALFTEAANALQQVVDLNVYELEDTMQKLYRFGIHNTNESVFEIQHNSSWPSDWSWMEGIDGNGIIQLCGIRGLCTDHPDYQAGWGFMMVTQSLYDHFLPDDTYRRDIAISSNDELEQEVIDAGFSCNPVVDVSQSNPIDYTGYWQEKYPNYKLHTGTNENGGDENLTKAQNTHSIRYADVLLMLAEALHRSTGADGDAVVYVDMVRERAAGPGDNYGNFKDAQTIMSEQGWSLLDLIWYERRAELAGEGDRWFDLVRSGRANSGIFFNEPDKANNFNDEHLWLPISLDETQVAPNLTTYPDASLFN